MFTTDFFIEHWIELLFGLISIGIVGYFRFLLKEIKNYKALLEQQDLEQINEQLKDMLKPIEEEITKINSKFESIKNSYKYRLIDICQGYLDKGYMTPNEYRRLTEMYKVYEGIGGNSQAHDYYLKAQQLPIHDDEEDC